MYNFAPKLAEQVLRSDVLKQMNKKQSVWVLEMNSQQTGNSHHQEKPLIDLRK